MSVTLHHHLTGPPHAPLLVLGPSLGTSMDLWEPQLDSLSQEFRVLRFDLPGHGRSSSAALRDTEPGATTVGELAALVLDIVTRQQGSATFHYAGISLGGAIGAHVAVHCPRRVRSLGLVCTSARFGEPGPWRRRASLVRTEGMTPLVGATPPRWFADPETAANTPRGRALLADLAGTEPSGYAACCDALAAYDLRPHLDRITAPTLVVAGTEDLATPLAHAEELARGIPHSTLRPIATGHLAFEQPQPFTDLLTAHLHGLPTA